jgi:hypothetical protein
VRHAGRLTAGYLSAWLQARHAPVRKVEITARDLRADRLLAEAQASGGDPLRLAHLFGISDPTAIRYCADAGGGGLGRPLPAESSIPRQVP